MIEGQGVGTEKGIHVVEPMSKRHFGTSHFVAVLFSEVENVLHIHFWGYWKCPLYRGCPFLGGSFIRGSTVYSDL